MFPTSTACMGSGVGVVGMRDASIYLYLDLKDYSQSRNPCCIYLFIYALGTLALASSPSTA